MKRFPMLNTLIQLIIALTVGVLEKLFILLYCLMPIGLFMLLMSFRSKNHKATALSAFTNENSEFQHIFPNYILVIVEPNILKRQMAKKINNINNFIHKYIWIFFAVILLIATLLFIRHGF